MGHLALSGPEGDSKWYVREGRRKDLKAVLALVRELAAYERAAHEVSLTLSQLEKDAEAGCFAWTVAEERATGQIIGMVLHHGRYSTWKGKTWYVEDLVVTEAWRGQGVGKALFAAVAQRAWAEEAQRLEWQVLDWNEPAIGFYRHLEASLDGSWLNGRLTREALKNHPLRTISQP
ncbi:MAG: GNAT family N-acetyltransferase [Bacteroidetes bacterium]|nr:GNAT family N-acetyltransferase [Bacteroidota bacterium]MDA0903407.1 GNAT family N-acetyltransferase [Bacteroidota bacterium]MDA1241561.1 GNAT family N-acetyltransferase [Bacteroidota bacterium]